MGHLAAELRCHSHNKHFSKSRDARGISTVWEEFETRNCSSDKGDLEGRDAAFCTGSSLDPHSVLLRNGVAKSCDLSRHLVLIPWKFGCLLPTVPRSLLEQNAAVASEGYLLVTEHLPCQSGRIGCPWLSVIVVSAIFSATDRWLWTGINHAVDVISGGTAKLTPTHYFTNSTTTRRQNFRNISLVRWVVRHFATSR